MSALETSVDKTQNQAARANPQNAEKQGEHND
jgi:hypothetical protein